MEIEWFEELPNNCPPDLAESPNGRTFYRIARTQPANDSDFFSHRMLYPQRKFNVSECRSRSISVHDSIQESKKLLLLPNFKGTRFIVELKLEQNDGLIKQTGNNLSHFSWWRAKEFNYDPTKHPIVFHNEKGN